MKQLELAICLWIDVDKYYSLKELADIIKKTRLSWCNNVTLWRKVKSWKIEAKNIWKYNSLKIKWKDFMEYYF